LIKQQFGVCCAGLSPECEQEKFGRLQAALLRVSECTFFTGKCDC